MAEQKVGHWAERMVALMADYSAVLSVVRSALSTVGLTADKMAGRSAELWVEK